MRENFTVQMWDLDGFNAVRGQPVKQACDRTWRGLDRDEWVRYISDLPYRNTCPN